MRVDCRVFRRWSRHWVLLLLSALLTLPVRAGLPPDAGPLLQWLAAADSMAVQNPARARAWQDSVYRRAGRRADAATQLQALIASSKIAIRQADYPTAATFANRAWQLAHRTGSVFGEWLALMAQAEIAYSRERYAEAVGVLRKALKLAEQIDNDNLRVSCFDKLGNCLTEFNQFAAANEWLRQSRAGYARLGDAAGESVALVNLSTNERRQGRLAAARQLAEAAVRVSRRQPDSLNVSNALNARANIRAAQGQGAAAVAEAQQALRLARQYGSLEDELVVLGTLGAIYEQAGRLPEALAAERRWMALNDSLNSADVARQMAELNTRFRVSEQQARITALTQQQRITALSAAQARTRARAWGLAAAGLAVLLLVGGGLLRQVRRQRAALAASEADLRRANTTKDQLMRVIGHDLRAPLTTFQQIAPVVAELADDPDPAEQRAVAALLADHARAVSGLVDNLLDWSRAQVGQVVAQRQPMRPAVLADSLRRLYTPVAQAKGVALHVEAGPGLDQAVWLDPHLLTAILRNLLSNALKFTPAGGQVRLQMVVEADDWLLITVADTGAGMPAAILAAALSGGAVRSTTGTAGEGGTGLGLAVCYHFAGLLEAEWRGESAPGAGTRWTLRLPARPAEAASV